MKKAIPKIILPKPTTNKEALDNVDEAMLMVAAFNTNITDWKTGNKTAGVRARACIHNLRKNASTINQSMTFVDKKGVQV